MKGMVEWFARNGVAANLLMVSLILLGCSALMRSVPVEVFPQFELENVEISAQYRGATPEEVEESVVVRIEEAIQDLEGIKRILSTAEEGRCRVVVEVESGYRSRNLLDDIQSRVDAISTLPQELEDLIVFLAQRRRSVISVVLAGDMSERDLRATGEELRDGIRSLPEIGSVELAGVRPYEVAVEAPESVLRSLGLTLDDVVRAVRDASVDLSAGSIRTRGGEILIHAKGRAYREEDFREIVLISRPDGTSIALGDIATISDGFEENTLFARYEGRPCVLLNVGRSGSQNAIHLAERVKEYAAQVAPTLPEGVELHFWNDYSQIVVSRLNTLLRSAAQGGILVITLLALFLRPALAFWVCLGIPVSFFGAIALIPVLGASINIVSLFGFILVLGIVVDDAIVTAENIHTHLEKGKPGLASAIQGTHEVTVPVVFGVLTTVAAFVPLLMVEGERGNIFAQIPLIVIPVLVFSLVESKLVLPFHLSHLKGPRGPSRRWGLLGRIQVRFQEGLKTVAQRIYFPLLKRALVWRYSFLSLFILVFLTLFALLLSNRILFVFFPRVDNEVAVVSLSMPVGTHEDVTIGHVGHIARQVEILREELKQSEGEDVIEEILSAVGGHNLLMSRFSPGGAGQGALGGQSHLGEVAFRVRPPEERSTPLRLFEILARLRQLIGPITGVKEMVILAEIGRAGSPLDIQLTGPDYQDLESAADEVQAFLARYPQLFDISHTFQDGKSEIRIRIRPEMELLGVEQGDLALQVRQGFFGAEAQRIPRGRDDVRVMVRYPPEGRSTQEALDGMHIRTRQGGEIPVRSAALLEEGRSPARINRIDRNRAINVRADADKATANLEAIKREINEALPTMLAKYQGVRFSLEGEAREQKESFGSVYAGLVLLFFAIYCLLAIPFRSYIQPLIVMSVIPFGLSGAIVGHIVMGMNVSMMSIFGMLALSGVLVNDSLVLVDYINRRLRESDRQDPLALFRAVCTSGMARFRAIMLTSMTTFAGLLPISFEKSTQAQFLIPMAVSLAWGVLLGTFVTLLLVPINYMILEDLRRFARRYWNWQLGKRYPSA